MFSENSATEDVANAYARTQNRNLKHLFDSCYVKPKDNFRVVQDDNAVKASVMMQAQERFEKQLENNNRIHNENLQNHHDSVMKDEFDFEMERAIKLKKQQDFKHNVE